MIRGSSFSVYYKEKLVVDLMGGASNLDGLRLWNPDSLGLVFSVSKALAGFCVALMVQRYCCYVNNFVQLTCVMCSVFPL